MGGSAVDDDWEFSSPLSEGRNVVLVGRTGNGKSSTGNSILRKRAFKSMSCRGVTSTCDAYIRSPTVESKLKETTHRLEQQLAEEMAQETQMKSNDEIRNLREHLERAQKETEDLRKQAQSSGCIIL